MSCSYAVLDRVSRTFVIVNATTTDHVDVLLDLKPDSSVTVHNYNIEDIINRVLYGDGTPYRILRMAFTAINGSVVSATLFNGTETLEHSDLIAMDMAGLILRCESYYKDKSKFIEDAVKVSRLGKEKECEEICAICHDEYQAEDMIGTIECKHSFHPQCIKEWLRRKENCPICRAHAVAI
ncbi:putative chromatin regulator PHD family [Helianthus debilis subsp. tardiflorus]